MDITASTEPRSDQLNFDDVAAAPHTVTITEVKAGTAEQPVEIHLAEYPGRPYKPSKSMRRVLVAAWGPEASNYTGRRMTLYGDPTVKFGGIALGGIKISHLSDLDGRLSIMLTASKGVRKPHVVEPLIETAPSKPTTPIEPSAEDVAACDDRAALKDMWKASGKEMRAVIEARVAELTEPENAQWDTPTDATVGDL